MSESFKINEVAYLSSLSPVKKVNDLPMSSEEVQLLRSFLQREIDVMRADMRSARAESARDHQEVKDQLTAVRNDIADLRERVSEVEAHEESIEHADIAREETKENIRKTILMTNAILGSILVIAIYVIDHV